MTIRPAIGFKWRSSSFFILYAVAIGQFTDLFLYGLVIPILPFLLRDRLYLDAQDTQSKIDLLLMSFSAASVLFAVPAGWLADWSSTRKAPYLTGLLALMAATALFAIVDNYWLLVLSRILQGLSAAIVNATGLAMVVDTVGSNKLGSTLGMMNSFIAVGELGAPPLGGMLYDKAGSYGVFRLGAAVIAVDLVMRTLVIEKQKRAKPGEPHHQSPDCPGDSLLPEVGESATVVAKQASTGPEYDGYFKNLPIIYCLQDIRLQTALLLTFVQALIIGTWDATLTIEMASLFKFSSLEAGSLFLALGIPGLFISPLAGWAVDRFGTRFVAVIGFGLLAPCLALLRLPEMLQTTLSYGQNVVLFGLILILNGISNSVAGAPGVVEACNVVEEQVRSERGLFGKNGPYGQIFGLNWLVFNIGLTVGPLWGGVLREVVGYGNMNTLLGGIAALAAMASFLFLSTRQE